MSPLASPIAPTANPSALSTGVTETLTTERTPLLDRKATTDSAPHSPVRLMAPTPSANRTRLLLAISFASFSGILSGMCLLFAKSGVELLLLTFRGQPQFWRWQAWVLVLGLIVFALLQLWYLHKGLVLADPTLVCPCASSTAFERSSPARASTNVSSSFYSRILLLQPVFYRQRLGLL